MPAAFIMDCVCEDPKGITAYQLRGRAIQGMFLNAVARISPKDAELLHEGSSEKPYTIGPVGRPNRHKGPIRDFQIRVTLLKDAHASLFLKLQSATFEEPLQLDASSIRIRSVHTGAECLQGWSGITPWEDIVERATTSTVFHFDLETPTGFQKSNRDLGIRRELPLPLPELVFGSLFRRWQLWSDQPLDDEVLHLIYEQMEVTVPLKLQAFEVPQGIRGTTRNLIGCVGHVTYRLIGKDIPERHIRMLNALANAAFFLGVGIRTTLGMGRIRRLTQHRKH